MLLYMAPGSSSTAVHIALHEVGASFEIRCMSFSAGDLQTAEFRAINPEGKVPTLVVEGRVLTEVAGILYYLARRFPAAGLLPQGDAFSEAEVVSWMSFLASTVHPARRAGADAALAVWRRVDARCQGRTFVVGDGLTIADIHLFRLFWRYRNAVKLPSGSLPAVEAHASHMEARPSVVRTMAVEAELGYEFPS